MNSQENRASREIFHKSSNETISQSLCSQLPEKHWKNDLFAKKKGGKNFTKSPEFVSKAHGIASIFNSFNQNVP
jgi:hypothetical protein